MAEAPASSGSDGLDVDQTLKAIGMKLMGPGAGVYPKSPWFSWRALKMVSEAYGLEMVNEDYRFPIPLVAKVRHYLVSALRLEGAQIHDWKTEIGDKPIRASILTVPNQSTRRTVRRWFISAGALVFSLIGVQFWPDFGSMPWYVSFPAAILKYPVIIGVFVVAAVNFGLLFKRLVNKAKQGYRVTRNRFSRIVRNGGLGLAAIVQFMTSRIVSAENSYYEAFANLPAEEALRLNDAAAEATSGSLGSFLYGHPSTAAFVAMLTGLAVIGLAYLPSTKPAFVAALSRRAARGLAYLPWRRFRRNKAASKDPKKSRLSPGQIARLEQVRDFLWRWNTALGGTMADKVQPKLAGEIDSQGPSQTGAATSVVGDLTSGQIGVIKAAIAAQFGYKTTRPNNHDVMKIAIDLGLDPVYLEGYYVNLADGRTSNSVPRRPQSWGADPPPPETTFKYSDPNIPIQGGDLELNGLPPHPDGKPLADAAGAIVGATVPQPKAPEGHPPRSR